MHSNDIIRLRHILDAAREAISFTKGKTRSDLNSDRMLVLALVKDIEIIGEAACRIQSSARDELTGVPWDDIIGMRHRLVHAYFDINLNILWQTLQDDLPLLITVLENNIPPDRT